MDAAAARQQAEMRTRAVADDSVLKAHQDRARERMMGGRESDGDGDGAEDSDGIESIHSSFSFGDLSGSGTDDESWF